MLFFWKQTAQKSRKKTDKVVRKLRKKKLKEQIILAESRIAEASRGGLSSADINVSVILDLPSIHKIIDHFESKEYRVNYAELSRKITFRW